uniref:F-box domain-containing protein n=1 Tax=Brassica oleracea var. oleracea TaxID=109376 RepID=A0A0D3AVR7_BRAOL
MSPFKKRRTLKSHREELLLLPDDVVELILERLPVKSLLRFRSVSKKLKSAIDFRHFQERQMLRGGDPDVLFVATNCYNDDGRCSNICVWIIITVHVPTNWGGTSVYHSTCDGLLCLYSIIQLESPRPDGSRH